MPQIEIIIDQLNRSFDGEAWHGPAVMEILEGVDAKSAAARPIATAHGIWELVLHLGGWERVVIARLRGEKANLSDAENFPHITDSSEKTWRDAIQTLRHTHSELLKAASSLTDAQLSNPVAGEDYDVLSMLLGAVQHAAYHGGQIALLKRAVS